MPVVMDLDYEEEPIEMNFDNLQVDMYQDSTSGD